jgi:hypothetical protein
MHMTAAQCVDAARGTLGPGERLALELHIQECADCADLLQFWRGVADLTERDGAYEPPPSAVEAVRNYRMKQARAEAPSRTAERLRAMVATLTFDTFQQALPVGVRTGTSATRQLVYVVAPLLVDLRFETSAQSKRVVLAGQISNTRGVAETGQDARVAVMGPAEELTTAVANEFGEFHCEFEGRDDLTLSISLKDGVNIAIPLDRLPVC